MAPQAVIIHKTFQRMRLKIASRRGESSYFASLERSINEAFPDCCAQSNAVTGSVLITGESLNPDDLEAFGRHEKLFVLKTGDAERLPVAVSVTTPLHWANQQLQVLTGGRVDLPGGVFFTLLGFGIIELIRG